MQKTSSLKWSHTCSSILLQTTSAGYLPI